MIHRQLSSEITRLSKHFKVTAVLGPRQSGKTTLCRYLFPDYHFFSLEDAVVVQEIAKSPKRFLEEFAGKGIIFDEAQKYPELFPVIKVVADENPHFRFILTGSSNFLSMEKITICLLSKYLYSYVRAASVPNLMQIPYPPR